MANKDIYAGDQRTVNAHGVSSVGVEQGFGPKDLSNNTSGHVDVRGRIKQQMTELNHGSYAGLPVSGVAATMKDDVIPAGAVVLRVEIKAGAVALDGTLGLMNDAGSITTADLSVASLPLELDANTRLFSASATEGSASVMIEYMV